MTGCMISGWGNAARTGYGSKFEKLLMKGVVGYVDKETCNQKHGEGCSISIREINMPCYLLIESMAVKIIKNASIEQVDLEISWLKMGPNSVS